MSYEIVILVSAIVLIFLLAFIACNCFTLGAEIYRKGIEHGKKFGSAAPSAPIISKPAKKAVKESDEIKRYNAILRNLEAYDGTSTGQEEIDG